MLGKTLVLLLVLVLAMGAMAGAAVIDTVTLKAGNELAMLDLTKVFGAFDLGVTAGVDYHLEHSSITHLDIDLGDDYEGVIARLHVLPRGSALDPYGSVALLAQNWRFGTDDVYTLLEGGVVHAASGLGIAYQYCAEFERDDRVLMTWRFQF